MVYSCNKMYAAMKNYTPMLHATKWLALTGIIAKRKKSDQKNKVDDEQFHLHKFRKKKTCV